MFERVRNFVWIFDCGFRRLNNEQSPGWAPQALVFSMLGLLLFCWFQLKVGLAWGITLIGLLDTVAALHFLRRSQRQLLRFGVFGPTRARWWIESAALSWTLCMSCGLFSVTQANGAVALPLIQAACIELAFQAAKWSFYAALVLTCVGFLVGLAQAKPIHGRALDLVSASFWFIVFLHAIMWGLPDDPILSDLIAPVCGAIAVAALLVAGAIAIWHWVGDRAKTSQ